jgi:hypothetical protein
MHGQAYHRKVIIPHLNNALEEYLWLASQIPAALLDAAPADASFEAGPSVRRQLLDLALELDTVVYPALIALLDGREAPSALPTDEVAARRAAWNAADLMVAMKQIRYRFQATEALLQDTMDIDWSTPAGPTPLAQAVFALWRQLLQALDTLGGTVAALEPGPPAAI